MLSSLFAIYFENTDTWMSQFKNSIILYRLLLSSNSNKNNTFRHNMHIDVMTATTTVTPALVSSVASDSATAEQEINKIKNKNHYDVSPIMVIADRRRHQV